MSDAVCAADRGDPSSAFGLSRISDAALAAATYDASPIETGRRLPFLATLQLSTCADLVLPLTPPTASALPHTFASGSS